MIAKLFEVRDRGTMIPVLAVQLGPSNEAERWLLSHAGYSPYPETQVAYVWLAKIAGNMETNGTYDAYEWNDQTMQQAHRHIAENFDNLPTGSVICTEYLRGERPTPKASERLEGVQA